MSNAGTKSKIVVVGTGIAGIPEFLNVCLYRVLFLVGPDRSIDDYRRVDRPAPIDHACPNRSVTP